MVSTEVKMICKSIGELTKEIKMLRKTLERNEWLKNASATSEKGEYEAPSLLGKEFRSIYWTGVASSNSM